MKKKNIKWIILAALAVLIIGYFIAKAAGWINAEKPSEVEFGKVLKSNLVETVSASGKIQPEVEIKITPDVPGEIIGLYVKEGDSVKKGQLLVKIQPENYASVAERYMAGVNQSKASAEQAKASIARSESQVMKAETDFRRQQKLFDEKVISQADFETAQTNLKVAKQDLAASKANYEASNYGIKSAEAAFKDASTNLKKTNIYAPANGIVSKLSVEPGERVVGTSQMAGTEIMRIANLNNMEVRVNVNENDIIRVSMHDTVLVDVDAYSSSGKKFKGIVTQIANTANGQGGSLAAAASSTESVTEFEVRIKILPSSYQDLLAVKKYPFKPGMTATVDIITDRKNNVLAVPISAVTVRSGKEIDDKTEEKNPDEMDLGTVKEETGRKDAKEIVFVNNNGVAKKREVKTGITDTILGSIEILSGLKQNDEIVIGPFLEVSKKLKDGTKIVKLKKDDKPK